MLGKNLLEVVKVSGLKGEWMVTEALFRVKKECTEVRLIRIEARGLRQISKIMFTA